VRQMFDTASEKRGGTTKNVFIYEKVSIDYANDQYLDHDHT
jgi:hypothetical protein